MGAIENITRTCTHPRWHFLQIFFNTMNMYVHSPFKMIDKAAFVRS
jgi:hypothetical protein